MCIITLSRTDALESIETPDNKYLIINDFNTKVAAFSVQTGHKMPCVCFRVVGLNTFQMVIAIESTYLLAAKDTSFSFF